MKKAVLTVAAALGFASFAAIADEPSNVPVSQALATKRAALTDDQLDAITAGDVTIVNTGPSDLAAGPVTWLNNNGNANVFVVHKNGGFTCINVCGLPSGGGGGGGCDPFTGRGCN
jgi:hypothetical protein